MGEEGSHGTVFVPWVFSDCGFSNEDERGFDRQSAIVIRLGAHGPVDAPIEFS
jgi:hypothetical protein